MIHEAQKSLQTATLSLWLLMCGLSLAGFLMPEIMGQALATIEKNDPVIMLTDMQDAAGSEPAEEISPEPTTTEINDEAPTPPAFTEVADSIAIPTIPNIPTFSAPPQPIVKSSPEKKTPAKKPALASNAKKISNKKSAPATTKSLTFGVGEGRQPAPSYPSIARRNNQQGKVIVEFFVNESGTVVNAYCASPSPYAALNAAALQTIKNTWHFPAGSPRKYRVPIQFRLN